MIDITQHLRENNMRITIKHVNIQYANDGMLIQGYLTLRAFGQLIHQPTVFLLDDDSVAGRKAFELKRLTDIKDGGYGFPAEVDLIFDTSGNVVDLEGEPTNYKEI